MKKVTLTNNFHNTKASFLADENLETLLRRATVLRIRRELCGIKDCTCGGYLGERPHKGLDIAEMPNGEVLIRSVEL